MRQSTCCVELVPIPLSCLGMGRFIGMVAIGTFGQPWRLQPINLLLFHDGGVELDATTFTMVTNKFVVIAIFLVLVGDVRPEFFPPQA